MSVKILWSGITRRTGKLALKYAEKRDDGEMEKSLLGKFF